MEEAPDNNGEPIACYPALVESIKQRKTCMEDVNAAGDRTLWLPVWLNDKVSTCLEVTNPTPYSSHTLHMMEGILSVYRNYQNILDYSERDSLTGLLNRKTFDEKFSRLLTSGSPESALQEQDERRHQPASGIGQWLAVVDIDHFKRVNDQFGHLYGDEVLLLIANLLQASFRGYDKIFRFGGEEFVILLRSTTLPNARRIFNRFRQRVEQHNFPQVGQVTVSLGFREMANMAPAILLGEVDQALYYAKEHGRNQVCHYEDLVAQGLLKQETMASDVELF
jgi:diguanylate cyclase (GGDEF)-like protein